MGEDKRRLAKIIGAAAAFVFSVALLLTGYALGNSGGYFDARADGYAAEYEAATRQRVQRCLSERPLTALEAQECVQEAVVSSREQQRSEQDLSAQRQMSQWAFWLLIATIIQMPMTAIGLVLLLQTIWQGQRAADAAQDQAAIAREALRPHLVATRIEARFGGGGGVSIFLENRGGSTARAIKADGNFRVHAIYGSEELLQIDEWVRDCAVSPLPASGSAEATMWFSFGESSTIMNALVGGPTPYRLMHLLIEVQITFAWAFGTGTNTIVARVTSWSRSVDDRGGWLKGEGEDIRELEGETPSQHPEA